MQNGEISGYLAGLENSDWHRLSIDLPTPRASERAPSALSPVRTIWWSQRVGIPAGGRTTPGCQGPPTASLWR